MNARAIGRRVTRWLVVTAAVVIVAAAAVYLSIDEERIRTALSELLSETAGAEVELAGPISVRVWPRALVIAHELRIDAETMSVDVDRVEADIDITAVLGAGLRVDRLTVVHPVLRLLEPSEAGGAKTPVEIPDPQTLAFGEIEIRELEIQRGSDSPYTIHRLGLERARRDALPIASVELDEAGTLTARARFKTTDRQLRFDALEATVAGHQVSGELALDLTSATPRLGGRLVASEVAFRGEGAPLRDTLASEQPIAALDLSSLDVTLEIEARRIAFGGLIVDDVRLPFESTGDALRTTLTGSVNGGALELAIERDAARMWRSRLALRGAEAGALLAALGTPGAGGGGSAQLDASLTAIGASPREIVASLAGQASARLGDFTLTGGWVERAAGDLASGLLDSIGGARDRMQVACAVARFDVERGVARATRSIGMQTRAVNLLGSGVVSLPEYRIGMVFRPWPRSGLGVGAGTLAGSFSVAGPLDAPGFSVSDDALLKGGASVGAALVTGGLSLIAQGLYERGKGDDPCGVAAGQRPSPAAASRGAAGAARSVGDSVDKATRSVKRGLKKADSFLKGLLPRGGGATSAPESEPR